MTGDRDATPLVGVPAYFSPRDRPEAWRDLTRLEPGSLVVVNPDSGASADMAQVYRAPTRRLARAGVRVYGYVPLQYGDRSVDEVWREACRFHAELAVEGLFLDQLPSDPDVLDCAYEVAARAHRVGLRIAANPGQPDVPARVTDTFDEVVTFEGHYDDYISAGVPMRRRCRARQWHLVYGAPPERQGAVVRLAGVRGAAIAYATDLVMPNPWDGLPAAHPVHEDGIAGSGGAR